MGASLTTGIAPAERRDVGSTGVRVSRLGVGGGSSFMRAGDRTSALVGAAWDAGLRHFDTAPLYGGGDSERRLGSALSARPRDKFVLSTKVGREPGRDGQHVFDYSARHVRESLLRSCERLRTDHIDIVFIHDIDPDMHGEEFEARFDEVVHETYPALVALRGEGVVRAIGVGLKDWDVSLRLAEALRLDGVMLAGGYTLLQHGALDALLPWCERNGVGVLVAAPFNTGILATGAIEGARYYYRPAPPDILERTRRIEAACARHGVPLPAAALQFPLRHPAVVSVVVGHEGPDEVVRNTGLLTTPLPAGLWSDLREGGLIPA
jgi:D-threo-aldose 1-dehydrogenase